MTDQPPEATPSERRADCERIAREAAALLRSRFGDPGVVSLKGEDPIRRFDLVTEVDELAERLVLSRIAEVAPDAYVLAEEGGYTNARGEQVPAPEEQEHELWLVDPLDGTINFAHNIPHFAVSIACWRDGRPTAGAIMDPMVGELFSFERNEDGSSTAFHDGNVVPQLAPSSASETLVYIGSSVRRQPELLAEFRGCRQLASAALALVWTGVGRTGAYIQSGGLNPWDWGVGAPFVQAAGGIVTDDGGSDWGAVLHGTTGIIAGASGVHADIVRILGEQES